MFGFLRGNSSLTYRQAYSRCCRMHHRLYGRTSLPFVSFEGVWLYLASRDLGGHPGPPPNAPRCCRMRKGIDDRDAGDTTFAEFAAALGMLLAEIKLNDDVADDRSWLARFATWRMATRFRKVQEWFRHLDPDFGERIRRLLAEHAALEQRTDRIPLEDYVRPTAEAFGYVFSLATRLGPPGFRNREEDLAEWGRAIGAAIIAVDAAVDWDADRRRRRFNPLVSRHEVVRALAFGRERLVSVGWQCVDVGGPESPAAAVIRNAIERISHRLAAQRMPATNGARPAWVRRVPLRWRRAGICDGCEILACVCDGAAAGDLLMCCDPTCLCCTQECLTERNQRKGPTENRSTPHDGCVGQIGVAVGPWRSSGMVRIAEVEVPARTHSGELLDAETPIRVVAADRFGVIVERMLRTNPGT